MPRFQFEGLTIESAADVARAFRAGTRTHPRDERPWRWILRFVRQGPEARALVAEAVAILVADEGGDDLRPTPPLREIMTLAEIAGVQTQLPALRRRLARGFGADTDDASVRVFLQWVLGARPDRASAPLETEEVERIASLAERSGCFGPAVRIVCRAAPWRLSALVAEAGPSAFDRGENFVERLALVWRKPAFAPYRLELLRAADEGSRSLLAALRAQLERMPRADEILALLDLAAASDDRATTHAYAQMVARTFFEGGARVRRALLVHPRDQQGLPPDEAGDFATYAAAIQAGADELLASRAAPEQVSAVGEPHEVGGEPAEIPARLLLVPVSIKGGRSEDIGIMRLRDRFKVAPAVASD